MLFTHELGSSLSVGSVSIYYEEVGDAQAPPILLLHGGIGTLEDFNVMVPTLAKDYRLIGIDSRGHGRSTLGSETLSYHRLEKDAISVLQHLEIEQASIIGFSDGGIVGYRLMRAAAIRISALITIGAPGECNIDDPVRSLYAGVTGASWRKKFPVSDQLYQRLNPEPDFDRLVASAVGMWLDTTPSGYPVNFDRLHDLLVIRGDRDHLFSRQAAVTFVEQVGNCSFANIPMAGHVAHEDQPNIVLAVIQTFLRSVVQS